jgi:hypothetical protein
MFCTQSGPVIRYSFLVMSFSMDDGVAEECVVYLLYCEDSMRE